MQEDSDQSAEGAPRRRVVEGRGAFEMFSLGFSIGSHLLLLRKGRKLSQRGLAKTSGVQQADISRLESGAMIPTVTTLVALLGAMDATLIIRSKDGHERTVGKAGSGR